MEDFQTYGAEIPLLVNCQPAGEWLGEMFYRAGGVPSVMSELLKKDKIDGSCLTATGKTMTENLGGIEIKDERVIKPYDEPLMENAGFILLSGNVFDSGLIKTSVIGEDFRKKYLSTPGDENAWEGRAIVFEGPEDYHDRINDPDLDIDEDCILFVRGCGPVGYPGSAEVVNMLPPDRLVKLDIPELPCVGDGRQSGTSASPSILNCSPEAAVGGNLAILKTGDIVRVDLNTREVNMQVDDAEIQRRKDSLDLKVVDNQTPWEEIYRSTVTQLSEGAVMKSAVKYQKVKEAIPRHSH